VTVARLLPVVRTFIALPAGIAAMPMLPFQCYTFAGSWPWCYALAYVGYKLGERWESDPGVQRCTGSTSPSSGCSCSVWPGSCGGSSIIPGMKAGHGIDRHNHTGVQQAVR
jgi:SNARE associated Golgi protein